MSKHSVSKVVIVILALIAIVFAGFIFYGYGSIFPEIPLPEDKARLLRYLSCAYAMCANGCMTNEVIDILLDGGQGCYDHCSKIANERGVPLSSRICGKDSALTFIFNRETTLYSNTPKWMLTHLSMETDITKYKKWYDKYQARVECFEEDGFGTTVKLDGRNYGVGCEYGGAIAGKFIDGLCEGVLRISSDCSRVDTGPGRSTGHIWIDQNIVEQCDPFETSGYLGNCTFNGDQTIYIWTEEDIAYPLFEEKVYCPEVIICSNI